MRGKTKCFWIQFSKNMLQLPMNLVAHYFNYTILAFTNNFLKSKFKKHYLIKISQNAEITSNEVLSRCGKLLQESPKTSRSFVSVNKSGDY